MKKQNLIIGVVAVFIIGSVIGNVAIQRFNTPPEPSAETQSLAGTTMPAFALPALDGVIEQSEQWADKVRIINFWATWCLPCKKEIPMFMELQTHYQAQGAQFIGIALLDDPEAVKNYVTETNINYPILLGGSDSEDIATLLGNDVGIIPYTVLIDRDGDFAFFRFGEISREQLDGEIKKLL